MFLAMAEDIRVVLIKLADRLHNMRTLEPLPPEKQRRIAQETMEIYAPLANRLGIWQIKWELEDLAFRYLEPEKYQEIAGKLDESRARSREKYIARVIEDAARRSSKSRASRPRSPAGRSTSTASAARCSAAAPTFDQIYDLLAVRVLVDDVADCYHALGVVHALWHPLPGQFDDYIAKPKESMYQSLHTTVMAPGGRPLEIQIRTHEMHQVAEYGIAAHWRYKEGQRRRRRSSTPRSPGCAS